MKTKTYSARTLNRYKHLALHLEGSLRYIQAEARHRWKTQKEPMINAQWLDATITQALAK